MDRLMEKKRTKFLSNILLVLDYVAMFLFQFPLTLAGVGNHLAIYPGQVPGWSSVAALTLLCKNLSICVSVFGDQWLDRCWA